MILGVVIISLVLVSLLTGRSWELWSVVVTLVIIWIGASVLQIFGLARGTRM
jgi:hypothetical protein